MQYWSEEMSDEYIAGDRCTIPDVSAVANLLSADWYHERWPLIPSDELYGSSVTWHGTQVLMHRRRVPDSALVGDTTIPVCTFCRAAYWTLKPKLSKTALTNDLWLGRLPPCFGTPAWDISYYSPLVALRPQRFTSRAAVWTKRCVKQLKIGAADICSKA